MVMQSQNDKTVSLFANDVSVWHSQTLNITSKYGAVKINVSKFANTNLIEMSKEVKKLVDQAKRAFADKQFELAEKICHVCSAITRIHFESTENSFHAFTHTIGNFGY